MRRTPVLISILALAAFLIVSFAASRSGSAASRSDSGEVPWDLLGLQCSADDLVMVVHADIGEDAPGGPATDLAALQSFLANEFPTLPREAFVAAARASDVSQYDVTSAGRTLAQVQLERLGDSWYVTGFEACNRYLIGLEGR